MGLPSLASPLGLTSQDLGGAHCSPRFYMAVAQRTGTQNGTLVSGNMDQHLRNPSCVILWYRFRFGKIHI